MLLRELLTTDSGETSNTVSHVGAVISRDSINQKSKSLFCLRQAGSMMQFQKRRRRIKIKMMKPFNLILIMKIEI